MTRRIRRASKIFSALVLVVLTATCAADDDPSSNGYDPGPVAFDSGVVAGSHDCVPPDGGDVEIAWEQLRNPIYQEPAMTKDQTVRYIDGRWHMWFGNRSRPEQGFGVRKGCPTPRKAPNRGVDR